MTFRGRTVALLVIASIAISSLVTTFFLRQSNPIEAFTSSLSSQEEKTFNEQQDKLLKIYSTIKKSYIRPTNEQDLMNGAIEGMVKSIKDPYSEYMNPEEAKEFHTELESSFSGIGAGVTLEGSNILIYSIMKGSPAEKAGLKVDDEILKVDGKSIRGMELKEAVSKIRGPKGSKVKLEISRGGQTFIVEVKRDEVSVETVSSKMLSNKTGYISISQFSEKTDEEFFNKLNALEKQGLKGLIIDVRGNPGGILPVVLKIAEQFVPEGKTIMKTQEKNGNSEVYKGKAEEKKPYPISVMIDKGSASASEILAAALQEAGGYPIIGERSYGKGTVQTAMDLEDGSNLKLTVAKWLTPNGNWIDKHGGSKGIQPNVPVKQPAFAQYNIPQLKKSYQLDDNATEISQIQKVLSAIGYKTGRVDGYFDQQTLSAVKKFQADKGIDTTGKIDQRVAQKLAEAYQSFLKQPENDKQLQMAIKVTQEKQ